jgi:hypothetical protein
MLGYNIIFVTFNNYMNIIKNISIRNHYLTIMGPYDKGTVLAFPNARTVPLFLNRGCSLNNESKLKKLRRKNYRY